MRTSYSPTADALALWLVPGGQTVGAKEIAPDTFADFDKNGRLLGIEVLNAGHYYDQAQLEQLPRAPMARSAGTRHRDGRS